LVSRNLSEALLQCAKHLTANILVDAQILGLSGFEHINDLRYDPGYLKIKGDINEFPEESA
jgi:CheY-like chemotaxis protein